MLQQRSFYPLYPPNEEMNVDFEKLEAHAQINTQPHVLIVPSDFLHFFKVRTIRRGLYVVYLRYLASFLGC